MKQILDKEYSLDNSGIERAVAELGEALKTFSLQRQETISCLFSLEEILLSYQEKLGETGLATIAVLRRMGSLCIQVRIPGPMYSPFDEENEILSRTLNGVYGRPIWSYRRNENRIQFQLTKKQIPALLIFAAVFLAALLSGYLVKTLAAEEACAFLSETVTHPLLSAVMGILSTFIMPMILFSVWQSVYSLEDLKTFSRVGRVTIRNCLLSTFGVGGLLLIGGFLLVPLSEKGSGVSGVFEDIFSAFLGIFPENLLAPFLEENTLQVAFLAVVFGVFTLLLGDYGEPLKQVLNSINLLFRLLTEKIMVLVYPILFLSVFNLSLDGELAQTVGILQSVPLTIVLCLIGFAIYGILLFSRFRGQTPSILKILLPETMIALATNSSSATMPLMYETFRHKLKTEKSVCDFSIPIGHVFNKPGSAILTGALVISCARALSMEVNLPWCITAICLCLLMSIAAPPVVGGSLLVMTAIFTHLNIPEAGLDAAYAIFAITGHFVTALSSFGQQTVLCLTADGLGKFDRESIPQKPTAK